VGGATSANANRGAGIRVAGSTLNTLAANTVERNLASGVVVSAASNTTIGGTAAADANTISSNVGDGILLTDNARLTTVQSNAISANTGNGNQSANPQIVITAAPAVTNSLIGGWAVVNGADFAGYRSTVDPVTGAFGVGAIGTSLNSTTPFGAYSANAITAGVAADNINTTASVADITGRTINSWAVRNTGGRQPGGCAAARPLAAFDWNASSK
jgi:parallel beta-helix repeat protein